MCCGSRNLFLWIVTILAALLALIALLVGDASSGIQAELVGAGGEIIPDGTNVLFDNVLNVQSPISYDPATGEFTVTEAGNYNVAWWTAPDGAGPATSISFTVAVNGVPYSTASSPIVSVQMSANAFVTIDTVPATISLVNTTGEDVFVPDIPVQAGITITK